MTEIYKLLSTRFENEMVGIAIDLTDFHILLEFMRGRS